LKRLLIFALLGPPIGMLTGMLALAPILAVMAGDAATLDFQQIAALPALLPVAYVAGLAPALLASAFDGFLGWRKIARRPLWCALFGFAASFLPLAASFSMGFLHGPLVLAFGLVGAAPAALCSWIAGKMHAQRRFEDTRCAIRA
jgi:Family of unknown function (DUF5413)